MANTLRLTLKSLYPPLLRETNKLWAPLAVCSVRQLYNKKTLGLDGFAEQKAQIKKQMETIETKFREKMRNYVQEDSTAMIFTEDLKNMVHLAESDDDLNLVVQMAKRFNSQNKQLRFGNFVFGPVIMRMFYLYNKPDLAIECFKSPQLDGLFDQLISYQILLDLLYENEKYQEILELFDVIKSKQISDAKYPRNAVVLALAACYKLNTKEAFEYAVNLWNQLKSAGHYPMRRATTFMAGLALNQGKPDVALEVIANATKPNYVTVRNIKVKALINLDRLDDVIHIMKSIISEDRPGLPQLTFNRDLLQLVKTAVSKSENPELSVEFNRLETMFLKEGRITDQTLDEQLCSEIQSPAHISNRQQNQYSRYNPSSSRTNVYKSLPRSRPGLDDMA